MVPSGNLTFHTTSLLDKSHYLYVGSAHPQMFQSDILYQSREIGVAGLIF